MNSAQLPLDEQQQLYESSTHNAAASWMSKSQLSPQYRTSIK